MRNIISVSALLFLTILATSACSIIKDQTGTIHEGLSFEITLVNDTYNIGNDILTTWKITNVSDDDILVNKRLSPNAVHKFSEIDFIIMSPSQQELNLFVDIEFRSFPTEEDFVLLVPGQMVTGTYMISQVYGPFDQAGIYSIQAIYNNHFDPPSGNQAWKEEIFSNTVNFEIIP